MPSPTPPSQTPAPAVSAPAAGRRNLWQRRLLDPVVAQLTQGITPEKIAMTVAIGSAIALFPIFGTTTLLCFLVALALRLNQPIIQLINQALWPVHVPVILWCARLGESVFGVPHTRIHVREVYGHAKEINRLLWHDPALFFHQLGSLLHDPGLLSRKFGTPVLHAVVGWALLAPFYIVLCYYALLPVMRAINRIHLEQEAKSAGGPPPS